MRSDTRSQTLGLYRFLQIFLRATQKAQPSIIGIIIAKLWYHQIDVMGDIGAFFSARQVRTFCEQTESAK